MNPIPNPTLGRRLRRAGWQCLLLVLVGIVLSSTARAQPGYGSVTDVAAADAGDCAQSHCRA